MAVSEHRDDKRLYMVNGQLRTSDVNNAEILSAFLEVAREKFTAPNFASHAYVDAEVAASGPPGRKMLAPRTLGLLLQAAAIQPGERVLDVGGGAGYSAALLTKLGAKVVLLETDASAARRTLAGLSGVDFVEGDLAKGDPTRAPFDAILVNGGFAVVPDALLAQLSVGGRLVGIDSREGANHGIVIDRSPGGFGSRILFDGRADVLPGFERKAGFVF